ncbi:MAG: glycosyltransferase [Tistlia sp.]|uniref:glycosyltransferase n=1 Tax=Tistlia sp. TaxID=3057121 RepID=UPI0034A37B38
MEAGLPILALPRYGRLGASSRLRLYDFDPYLRDAGLAPRYRPLLDDGYLRRFYGSGEKSASGLAGRYLQRVAALLRPGETRLFWIEKELLPFLPFIEEALLARSRRPVVLDLDDAWMLRYEEHPRAAVRRLLGHKFRALVRRADLIVAANRHLQDWAEGQGARATLLVPTVVDHQAYPPADHGTADGALRLAWIGSPTTSQYLGPVLPLLAQLAERRPLTLVLIGAGPVEQAGLAIERVAWSEAAEKSVLASCHLGIMPLSDGPWERGKSGFKLIQYMAAGLPVVASPVGANRDIVTPDTGFLAADGEAWRLALERLLPDPRLRATMGAAGRRRVESDYSLVAWGPRLASALRRLADEGRQRPS